MLNIVLSLTCKIFIILIIGIIASHKKVIDENMKKNLSTLLMNIVLPLSIISASQQKFDDKRLIGLGQSLLISIIYYIVAIGISYMLTKKIKMNDSKKRIFIMLTSFANVGFIGFSIMGELIGETGTLYTIIHNSVYQLIYFSYGIYLLSENNKLNIKNLFGNKIIWISISSIILYLLPIRIPQIIMSPISIVGGMMMPLSMLIIGADIGMMKLNKLFVDKQSYIVSFLRMIVFPLMMLGAMRLFNIDNEVAITAVILTALPSGSLNVIMASEYNREPEFATIVVTQNMLLMILTIPILLLVLNI